MSGLSIPRPSTTVEQEFVATTPSFATPNQQACLIGPCYQIVSALDDNQLPLDEAYAGPYRDGQGVISYDFPSLRAGALVTEFLGDVRVFLVFGSEKQELNSVYDEVTVYAGTTGSVAGSSAAATVFTDAGVDFVTEGVAIGDVLRFTYQGALVDIEIDGVTTTTLSLDDASALAAIGGEFSMGGSAALTPATYTIVRNPAQWAYSVIASNSSGTFGTAATSFTLSIKPGAGESLQGSGGDGVQVIIAPQPYFLRSTAAFVGQHIFWATGQAESFVVDVGPAGPVASGFFLHTGASGIAGAFRDVLRVVTADILIVDTPGAGLTAVNYKLLTEIDTGADGILSGGGVTLTSAGGGFHTSIARVNPGVDNSPATATYVEVDGFVLQVTTVTSDTVLTLEAGAGNAAGPLAFTVAELVHAQTGVGNTGSTSHLCFASGGLTAGLLTGRAILTKTAGGGTWEGDAFAASPAQAYIATHIATIASPNTATSTASEGEIVDRSVDIALLWDAETRILTIQPARGADGLSTGGTTDPGDTDGLYLDGALSDLADPAYNAAIAGVFALTVTGSGVPFNEDAARSGVTLILDGGTDVGDILLDEDLIGSTTPTARVYVSYKALRTDVTAAADVPLFYEINDQGAIVGLLGDLPGNPLAIAAWYALAAGPTSPVRVLGVSDADGAHPNGTSEAYAEAFSFIEAKDIYAVVPLTQDPVVGQLLQAHVNAMSAPENAAERLGIINSPMPLYAQAEVIASGLTGNTGTVALEAVAEFSTSVDFLLAGAEAGDVLVLSGALAVADDHLSAANGTIGPLYGAVITGVKSGDRFVLEFDGTDFPGAWDDLVDVTWTLYRPGAAITIPADQAEAIAKITEGYADRRMIHVWPSQVVGPVDGATTLLEGFYAAAGVAGLIAQKKPAEPLTNANVPGFTSVKYSSGYFTKSQLDRMAGGGNFILIQDADGQPVKVRHQLSTDTSSIEKREISVTTALDYISDVYRKTLDPQIGIVNITDALLTDIATKAEGINAALVEQGICRNAALLSVEEDPARADGLIIEVGIRSLVPNNYNRVKLLVGGA